MRNPFRLALILIALVFNRSDLCAAESAAISAPASIPVGWFPWPYVEPVPGSALDSSALNHKPAGAHGPVIVRGSHFITTSNQARLRFWGCNLSSNEAFVDAATADRLARRLAMGGVNIARLHHLDNPWSVDSGGVSGNRVRRIAFTSIPPSSTNYIGSSPP